MAKKYVNLVGQTVKKLLVTPTAFVIAFENGTYLKVDVSPRQGSKDLRVTDKVNPYDLYVMGFLDWDEYLNMVGQ